MATSKPMSDGGKGSVRRNEDSDAYRNNYDAIFGSKKKQTKVETMNDDYIEEHDDDEDEGMICPACNGSGEGMYDGSTCSRCGGYGEISANEDDDYDY